MTSIRDGETGIGYYIGFDRAAGSERLPIYSPAACDDRGCDCVALHAISAGSDRARAEGGIGRAAGANDGVGAASRVPALNGMLRGLVGAVPHAEAPKRSPFKVAPSGAAVK